MNITLDDIKKQYKFHIFYLYHIKGKKWGCTLQLEKRLKKQGYTIEDTEEIKEVIGVEVADRLEKFLNEKEGYSYNHTQSYLLNLFRRVKNSRTPKKYNKPKNFNRPSKLSNRHKKNIGIGLKKAYEEGKRNNIDRSFMQTDEWKQMLSKNTSEQWKNPKRKEMMPKGPDVNNALFSEEQVKQIRQKYKEENTSYTKLAEEYNCSKSCIANIIKRKTYWCIK